jgi:hypothetical protein
MAIRNPAEFPVDHRHQLVECFVIPVIPRHEEVRHLRLRGVHSHAAPGLNRFIMLACKAFVHTRLAPMKKIVAAHGVFSRGFSRLQSAGIGCHCGRQEPHDQEDLKAY